MAVMKKWIARYYRLIIVIAIIGAAANTVYTLYPAISGNSALSGLETISVAASLGGIALLILALVLSFIDSRRKERERLRKLFKDGK
jgi:K+ transporter